MRPRLQPEDDGRDVARLRGREQIAADRRVGLGHAAVEFIAKALAQGLRGAADDPGDVVLTDTDPRQVPTFSRTASFTAKAVLAICHSRLVLVLDVGALVERLTRSVMSRGAAVKSCQRRTTTST